MSISTLAVGAGTFVPSIPVPDGLLVIQQRMAALSGLSGLGSTVTGAIADPGQTSFADSLASAMAPNSPADASAAQSVGATQSAVAEARSFLGVPYRWGGTDPSGFDCSGFTQYVMRDQGVTLPRVAADQANAGLGVPPAQAQPGDLVFFGQPVDHVGIYIGNGQMIDAPHTGAAVRVDSVDVSSCTAVRRVLPQAGAGSWASALPLQGQSLANAIATAAAKNDVDPKLLASVAWQESGFQAHAVSPAGAQGIMQLMPTTAAGMGVDPLDPTQALDGGARYLKIQLDRFGGRTDLALAAYNAGPTAVLNAGGIPNYPETQAYVSSVLTHLQTLTRSAP